MAKDIPLREYQKSLLDRLDDIKNTQADSAMSFLGVSVGDKNVLVALSEIGETVSLVDIQKVPLVKPWFLGVSNVRGVLYVVNDLLYMLTQQFTKITSSTRMMIVNDNIAPNVSFIADKLVGLRSLEVMKKRKEKSDDRVCFKPETYEDAEGRVWHVMDCLALVNSAEFTTPLKA